VEQRGQARERRDAGTDQCGHLITEMGMCRFDQLNRHSYQTTDKGQQQHDRGQGHAALAGEEFGHRPGGPGHQQAAGSCGNGTADPGTGHQQQHGCNGHEDIVEAGDQPELFLVRDGRVAHSFGMIA